MNRLFIVLGLVVLLHTFSFSSAQQTAVCNICTGVVTFAEPYAKITQETELQILMHAYCNMQAGMQTLCKDIVDRFMHFFYTMFQQSTPPIPHALCIDVRACSP